jgi:hypothetical protein
MKFPTEPPSHEIVFLELGAVPKRGIHLSARTRDAIEAECEATGLPVMAVIRCAIERAYEGSRE